MKQKCISASFVLNHMKILESGKQNLKSGKHTALDGDELHKFASSEAFGPSMNIHEHLGIIMESLNMESIYTGAYINSYLAAKGLWEQSKTSQTKCLPVPGDNIWTMWEITF